MFRIADSVRRKSSSVTDFKVVCCGTVLAKNGNPEWYDGSVCREGKKNTSC
jgi:hypothetical protein